MMDQLNAAAHAPSDQGDEERDAGQVSPASETALSTDADEPFDAPVRALPLSEPDADIDALIVNIEGYEGPLDVLLDLARAQKVDLRKISILALVEQYLAFIEAAKAQSLELAADYLVMAAWLAYLKSRLLLPAAGDEDAELSADEMAARLTFQLQRLEAMRNAVDELFKLPRLGVNVFPRGAPEGVRVIRSPLWQADLYDLLRAYAAQRIARVERGYKFDPPKVYSIEAARARLERMLGHIPDWVDLWSLAPQANEDAPAPSIKASALNAALDLAKDGRLDLSQTGAFQPIYVRRRETAGAAPRSGNAEKQDDDGS